MSLLQLGLCMLWCTKLGWQEANQWQIMTAVFSHVKFSGQRCCIFDKLWYFFQCCSSSSEFHSNAEACAVMNDCNQCNIFFPQKSTAKLFLANVHSVYVSVWKTELHRGFLDMDYHDSVYEWDCVCMPVCLTSYDYWKQIIPTPWS